MKHVAILLAAAFTVAACGDANSPVGTSEDAATALDPTNALVRASGDEQCVGTRSGTFENVFVPVGQTCTLQNSTVNGNVKALPNSRLFMTNNRVKGNIDGDEAVLVHVRGGTVGGSIQIKEANNPSVLGASITGGTVLTQGNIQIEKMNTGGILIADVILQKGNIKVEENRTRSRFEIVRNRVAQNVQAFKNLGTNAKFVRSNTIGQIVQCKENQAPFTGGPNNAGAAQDQCF